LYIRQSTLPGRQQHRVDRAPVRPARPAIALGWLTERIHVIDIDQGQSGASAADREGFRPLVAAAMTSCASY
jgi:hypothetical protein